MARNAKNKEAMSFWVLFTSMFKLSAFTFGGGYVIIPLMRQQFCNKLGWLDEEEMLDMTAIAQACPGPVAVNTSILTGYRLKKIPGALVALLGTILPPMIIISIISLFYVQFKENIVVASILKGMQPAIAAIIVDVVINLGRNALKERWVFNLIIIVLSFSVVVFLDVNVVWVIFACMLIGLIDCLFVSGRAKKKEEN